MNRLSPEAVDELFRHFDAGNGVRAASRETGRARATVGRYRRAWAAAAPRGRGGPVIGLRLGPDAADGLAGAAAAHGLSRSELAARIVEAAVALAVVEVLLA